MLPAALLFPHWLTGGAPEVLENSTRAPDTEMDLSICQLC